ncbi:MAG: 50S ribosomal protein L10 [Patescibacteria group bacterium]
MPKTRAQKEATLKGLVEVMHGMKSVVFANYEGLKVQEIETLRKACKDQGVYYGVAKKTLLTRAFAEAGVAMDPATIDGNFATVIGLTDEVAPAKVLAAFAKDHEALVIKGGILEGKLIDVAMVKTLSKLPSRTELLGRLVGTLNAPVSGFVNVLAGNLRGLVTVLTRIQESKV